MGLFDFVKQLENSLGTAADWIIPGDQSSWHQPAQPQPQQAPEPSFGDQLGHAFSNLGHAAGDALHGNFGGAYNDLLAKYGEKPAPTPQAPMFHIQPVTDFLNLATNPAPTLAKTALGAISHITTPIAGGSDQQPNLTVGEIARQLPQATADTAVNLAHGIADTAPRLFTQGADILDPGNTHTYQANDPVSKAIFGSEPVSSYQDQSEQFSQWLKDNNILHGNSADALSVPAAGLMAAMDLFAGGKGKDVAETVAKEATAAGVTKALEGALGKHVVDNIPKDTVDALVAAKDAGAVHDILQGHVADTAYKQTVANGGVTISTKLDQPGEGFAFAPYKDTETIVPKGEFTPQAVNDYMTTHADKLTEPGNHLGLWEDDGKIYLDISRVGAPTAETLQKAMDAHQLAAFDLKSFEEIPLGKIDKKGYSAIHEATNHPYLAPGKDTGADSSGVAGQLGQVPGGQAAGQEAQKVAPGVSPEAQRWAEQNGFASADTGGLNKESLRPEGVTQEQLDRAPKGDHLGNSKAAIEGKVNEMHGPNPVRRTPETPMLSDEHMDIPGKAPVDTKRPKISLTPPKNEKAIVKGFGSIRTVIRRQGEAGKELVTRMVNVRHTHEQLGQAFTDAIPTVRKLSNGREMPNFVDVVEGKAAPINKRVAQAVTEWQGLAKQIEARARQAGIEMGHIEDYFPHMFPSKFFANKKTYTKAVEHLVNTGQAGDIQNAVQMLNDMREPWQGGHRFGNLEKARNADIPGYRTDKKVVTSYIDRASRRIAEAEQFGKDNHHVDHLIGQMAKEGKDANAAQEAFNAYFHPPKTGAVAKTASGVRRGTSYLTLSKAALSHSTQTSNTAIITGIARTGHAWLSRIGNRAEVQWAKSIGINYDGKAANGISGVAPFLKQMRAQNRIVSAIAGKRYGNYLARRGKLEELKTRWGVQGPIEKGPNGRYALSAEQQAHMGHAIADATQFSDDAMDSPAWARTAGGKLVGQYRMAYQYKQGGFVYDHVLKQAAHGNLVPLMRAAVVIPIAGATVIEGKHLLGGKTDPTDLEADAEAGGLGTVPTALLNSTKYMYDGPSTARTLAGDVAPVAGMAVETGQNAYAAANGNSKPLEKQALGYIPFIGSGVKNAVFPSTSDPNAIAYAQGANAGRKTLKSTKDQGVWDALYGSNKDAGGNTIPSVYDPNNSPYVAEALLSHPEVLAAATKFYQDFHQKTGQAIDPLYDLNPDQQIAALNVRAAAAFPGELSADKKQLETQLPADYRQRQQAYYDSVAASLAAAGKDTGGLPGQPTYPTPNADVQAKLDAGNTKDPAVAAWLDQLGQYNNQKRQLMGLPEIAPYGYAAADGQIPNPSNPYAKKQQADKAPSSTFASTGGGGSSKGGSRKTGAGSRGGKLKIAKGRSTTIKLAKAPKVSAPPKTAASKTSVVKLRKVAAVRRTKVRLAKLA